MDNKFKIRDLCTDDIFPICDIIAKCGISEFKNCFVNNSAGNDSREAGINIVFDMAGIICKNISSCRQELYDFISGVSGLTQKDIAGLVPAEFIRLMKQIMDKREFRDFFSAASGLLISE